MRIFTLSDLHADHPANMGWLRQLSLSDYQQDALLVPGDVCDALDTLHAALAALRARFAALFFVPGNHDLWVRQGEAPDSIAKFERLLRLCAALDVTTDAARLGGQHDAHPAWVVPLFSWYARPEESPDSLFVPKAGEDPELLMWSDNYFTDWSALAAGRTVADHFLDLNEPRVRAPYDAPVLSFSHFLPRTDLIFPRPEEVGGMPRPFADPAPTFNFTRVAGSARLERQLRRLGSTVHVYGHQHRERHRLVDGVLYIAHHLGYPQERHPAPRHAGAHGPKLIWDTHAGAPPRGDQPHPPA